MLESGAVVLGSTVMPDWGMLSSGVSSLHGITRSPLDPRLTTGGSSSGAGAAAAGGFGPLHLGTDIGGSIRLPGTWLGLATLKPSDGRVPIDVPYLGRVAGPMARTVDDLALLMSVELLDQALKRRRAGTVRENVHESGEAEQEHPPSTDRNEDSAPRETPEKAEQVPAVRTATKSALRQ